jgi:hypothetical protein
VCFAPSQLCSAAPPEAELTAPAERDALVAAALRRAERDSAGGSGGGSSVPVAAHEFLLCASTPNARRGAPPLRHRLHATVAPGRATVATVITAPEP